MQQARLHLREMTVGLYVRREQRTEKDEMEDDNMLSCLISLWICTKLVLCVLFI